MTVRDIQYQVVATGLRVDGRLGGDVTLDTRCRVLGKDGAELAFGRSTVVENAANPGFEPMVAAMTRAVVSLAQEIAGKIRALPGGPDRADANTLALPNVRLSERHSACERGALTEPAVPGGG